MTFKTFLLLFTLICSSSVFIFSPSQFKASYFSHFAYQITSILLFLSLLLPQPKLHPSNDQFLPSLFLQLCQDMYSNLKFGAGAENVQYLSSWICFISLNTVFSSSTHLLAKFCIYFLFTADQYPTLYMDHISFTPSSVEGHLDCFHFLDNVNGAAMIIAEQVSEKQDVKFFGRISRSSTARSSGTFILVS